MKLKITMTRRVLETMTAEIEVDDEAGRQLLDTRDRACRASVHLWAFQNAPLHGGVWKGGPTHGPLVDGLETCVIEEVR